MNNPTTVTTEQGGASETVMPVTEAELNKIRERTFNRDLKDLVDKITCHGKSETRAPAAVSKTESAAPDPHEALLVSFHELFYKSVHLRGRDGRSVLNHEIISGCTPETIAENLYQSLGAVFQHFALLAFDFNKNCFRPTLNRVDESIDLNSILLDVSEDLYGAIMSGLQGIVLDNDAIERNVFLKKRFGIDGAGSYHFYFVSVERLYADFLAEVKIGGQGQFSAFPFPVIMAVIFEKPPADPRVLYRKLSDRITIPMILYDTVLFNRQGAASKYLSALFDYLEYYCKLFTYNRDGVLYVVRFAAVYDLTGVFILKYLVLKLRMAISNRSSIINISKNRLLIFTHNVDRKKVSDVLDDFKHLYDDLLFDLISFDGRMIYSDLIKQHFFQ